MKELVILSGKGGTGKTSITAAFSGLARSVVLCDTDVDAADLHLIVSPGETVSQDFEGGHEARIDAADCVECGICMDVCRFDAVNPDFSVDPVACEGCGVCVTLCPEQAIRFPRTVCGQWFVSATRFGAMVHAKLGIGQENSGKLVSLVRQEARRMAQDRNLDLILTDGPPGIGCPVIAAIGQATAILIVSEPTVSGHHDMLRVVELAKHFKVPAMVSINKYDINLDQTVKIEQAAEENHLPVVGRIPYDESLTRAMIRGQTIFEYDPKSNAAKSIRQIWQAINHLQVFKAPAIQLM